MPTRRAILKGLAALAVAPVAGVAHTTLPCRAAVTRHIVGVPFHDIKAVAVREGAFTYMTPHTLIRRAYIEKRDGVVVGRGEICEELNRRGEVVALDVKPDKDFKRRRRASA